MLIIDEEKLLDKENDYGSKYLVFTIDSQDYAISIKDVSSIIRVRPSTVLPQLPHYVRGVINLRGQTVPLIDLNMRFGKSETQETGRACIIILNINQNQAGLMANNVNEIIDIDENSIMPPPYLQEEKLTCFVFGVAEIQDRVILLLNAENLVGNVDI